MNPKIASPEFLPPQQARPFEISPLEHAVNYGRAALYGIKTHIANIGSSLGVLEPGIKNKVLRRVAGVGLTGTAALAGAGGALTTAEIGLAAPVSPLIAPALLPTEDSIATMSIAKTSVQHGFRLYPLSDKKMDQEIVSRIKKCAPNPKRWWDASLLVAPLYNPKDKTGRGQNKYGSAWVDSPVINNHQTLRIKYNEATNSTACFAVVYTRAGHKYWLERDDLELQKNGAKFNDPFPKVLTDNQNHNLPTDSIELVTVVLKTKK